jgi:hypothetical protein
MGKNEDAWGGRMADERRAHIERLRMRLRELHADFAFVEGEYRAGRIALAEEIARLTQITNQTSGIIGEYTALVPDRSHPTPLDSD